MIRRRWWQKYRKCYAQSSTFENSDKSRFAELEKRIDKNYVLNKAEYPRTVTAVQSLLLNYQPN